MVRVGIEIRDSFRNLRNFVYMQKAAAQYDARAQRSPRIQGAPRRRDGAGVSALRQNALAAGTLAAASLASAHEESRSPAPLAPLRQAPPRRRLRHRVGDTELERMWTCSPPVSQVL